MKLEVTSTGAPPAHSRLSWRLWAVSVAIAVAYFLAARLSLALLDKADGVAVFWPRAGRASMSAPIMNMLSRQRTVIAHFPGS